MTGAAEEPDADRADDRAPTAVRRVGDLTVVPLEDAAGVFPLPTREAFPGASDAEWAAVAAQEPAAAEASWWLPFRCFAVRRPDGGVVLVDAGVGPGEVGGPDWTPTPGRLPGLLDRHGIDVASVDTVVLTHLHTDHVGWAAVAGRATFEATYVVQEAEAAEQAPGTWVADRVVAPLDAAGRLERVAGRRELFPGISLVPTPGHSAGHQSVLLEGGGERAWLTGDVVLHRVQLVSEAVRYVYDADADRALHSRRALLADARSDAAPLGTAHLGAAWVPVPG